MIFVFIVSKKIKQEEKYHIIFVYKVQLQTLLNIFLFDINFKNPPLDYFFFFCRPLLKKFIRSKINRYVMNQILLFQVL